VCLYVLGTVLTRCQEVTEVVAEVAEVVVLVGQTMTTVSLINADFVRFSLNLLHLFNIR